VDNRPEWVASGQLCRWAQPPIHWTIAIQTSNPLAARSALVFAPLRLASLASAERTPTRCHFATPTEQR
jgi:hypothetical protein